MNPTLEQKPLPWKNPFYQVWSVRTFFLFLGIQLLVDLIFPSLLGMCESEEPV